MAAVDDQRGPGEGRQDEVCVSPRRFFVAGQLVEQLARSGLLGQLVEQLAHGAVASLDEYGSERAPAVQGLEQAVDLRHLLLGAAGTGPPVQELLGGKRIAGPQIGAARPFLHSCQRNSWPQSGQQSASSRRFCDFR